MIARAITLWVGVFLIPASVFSQSANTCSTCDKSELYSLQSGTGDVNSDPTVGSAIDWSGYFGVQRTEQISASFAANGTFGWYFAGSGEATGTPSVSFETPSGSALEYLFGGAVWVGGIVDGDTVVSCGADGWGFAEEFAPTKACNRGAITRISAASDFALRAEFADTVMIDAVDDISGRPFVPMNLRIANRSHVWQEPPYDKVVVYDMVITNIGDDLITAGYVGLYLDADIFLRGSDSAGHLDDLMGSMPDQGIIYVVDNNGDPVGGEYQEELSPSRALALKILNTSFEATSASFNWWASSSVAAYDFGPRQAGTADTPFRDFGTGGLGTPVGDANKYYIMSTDEWDYDQCYLWDKLGDPFETQWVKPDSGVARDMTRGWDVRFAASVGPFDLAPDSSVRVIFSTFTADSVHTKIENYRENLPVWPYAYLVNLGLEHLTESGNAATEIAATLLDPQLPPVGMGVQYVSSDSICLEWDPYVFPEVDGYQLSLALITPSDLPYPGVISPWLFPEKADEVFELDNCFRYVLSDVDPHAIYAFRLNHRIGDTWGQASPPVHGACLARPEPPVISDMLFAAEGEDVTVAWQHPDGEAVDSYRVYKFTDSLQLNRRHLPFYDLRNEVDDEVPSDTFDIDGTFYYYYGATPYRELAGAESASTEPAVQGTFYVITAVDQHGFESEMSAVTNIVVTSPPSRDILMLSNSSTSSDNLTPDSLIFEFYDRTLSGYDWERYDVGDSCPVFAYCRPTFEEIAPFRTIIIDDGLYDLIPFCTFETRDRVFEKYLRNGGRMIYCGAFTSFLHINTMTTVEKMEMQGQYPRKFFGVDSVFYPGVAYFILNGLPKVDTMFGFCRAEAVNAEPNDLDCDVERFPMGSGWGNIWAPNTPPSVATFTAGDRGEITHRYRSLAPSSSMLEGEPVGIHTVGDVWETYLYGFHLYYMEEEDVRDLLASVVGMPTGISGETEEHVMPADFALEQNYPNPFNPTTNLAFSLPSATQVVLTVYNVLGQEVDILLDCPMSIGRHQVEWDGTDSRGREVASGIYFYRLQTESFVETRKMALLK